MQLYSVLVISFLFCSQSSVILLVLLCVIRSHVNKIRRLLYVSLLHTLLYLFVKIYFKNRFIITTAVEFKVIILDKCLINSKIN